MIIFRFTNARVSTAFYSILYLLNAMESYGTAFPVRRHHLGYDYGYNYASGASFPHDASDSIEHDLDHCCEAESDENRSAQMEQVEEDPGEYGDFLEGDMVVSSTGRAGVVDPIKQWPNATVVYDLVANYSIKETQDLQSAMDHISSNTCIRFRQREDDDKDFVIIMNSSPGCYAFTGRKGGTQPINLSPACFEKIGTVIHELLHAVGIVHEHTRPDREDWIEINFGNIKEGKISNFNAKSWEEVSAFGEPYDYGSVMHYSSTGFAKNKSIPTISKKFENSDVMGQRQKMSPIDIKKVNKMYNCPNATPQRIDAIEFCGDP